MKKNTAGLIGVVLFLSQVSALAATYQSPRRVARAIPVEVDEGYNESAWYLVLGLDLGVANYSAYNNSLTEAYRSGLIAGPRATIAHYSDSFAIDGGFGFHFISNSGTNADNSVNTDKSTLPYFTLSPRYRFGTSGFQLGPEMQYWFASDKGLNPTIPGKDTIADGSNTSTWLGLQGLWEYTGNQKFRFGARALHGIGVSLRSVNVFQVFFEIGLDAFSGSKNRENLKPNEQVSESDIEQADSYAPRAPLPMTTPEPTPVEELNPDPVVMSTPSAPEIAVAPIVEPTPASLTPEPKLAKAVPKLVLTLDVNDLPFAFDSANLPKANAARVKNMGAFLGKNNRAWKKLVVSGHTDERGTRAYNLKISKQRAETVRKLLVSGGASSAKIKSVGYGPKRPKDRRHNEKAWTRNRRVELEFQGVKDVTLIKKSLNQ